MELSAQFYPQFKPKIRVIPQGFNFAEIRLADTEVRNDIPVFSFAGSILPGFRDPKLFLEYLSELDLQFKFIVYTNQMEWFRTYKIMLGDKLELRSYVDRLTLLYEMSHSDFLVNIDTVLDSSTNVEAVPSKLIDYALTNRPIMSIGTASLDKTLVQEFLGRNYLRQRKVNKENYDIRKVAKQFLALSN